MNAETQGDGVAPANASRGAPTPCVGSETGAILRCWVKAGVIQPTTHNPAPTEVRATTDTELNTTAQAPEPTTQPAPETLGEPKEGDEEDEHPSGRPPSPAQPERENTRQQEEREEGNPTANQATETALTEPEPGADPPAESREATKANPPPQGAAGEEGLTPTDKLLVAVYGDHIRADDGSLLDGGITTDRTWQSHWRRMTQVTPTHYSVPKGAVGRRFLTILTNEFRAVRVDRKANSEKP